MSTMLCDRFTNCLCPATPFRNLSAEAPDPAEFLAFVFVEMTPQLGDPDNFWSITDIPADCEALNRQDAQDCAVRNGQTEITDNWRNPNGTTFHMFGNHAVSCNFPCPDGTPDFVYTVPAGTVLGRTQAEADTIAASLCQERGQAAKDCSQPPVVMPTPVAWWDMEDASGNLIDIINGIPLSPFASNGLITYHQVGKIDFGIGMSGVTGGPFGINIFFDSGFVAMPYAGNGIDFTFWMKISTAVNAVFHFTYTFPGGDILDFYYKSDTQLFTLDSTGASLTFVQNVIDGVYHMYRVFFDPVTGDFGFDIDNVNVQSGITPMVPAAGANSELLFESDSINAFNPTNISVFWDEMAIWPRPLTPDEVDQVWNNGNGTTWPIV